MAARNIADMNDYCLIEIFKYLDNHDLTELSLTTKRFRELVRNHVVPQIMYDFDGASCQAFGKYATKISYNLYNMSALESFLDNMSYYCTPGLLTTIEVWYGTIVENRQIDQNLLDRTATYLENVKTLVCGHVDQFNEWLTSIPTHKMRTLYLDMKAIYDFRLNPESFLNLLDCTILIDSLNRMESYARYRERYDAITEFIKPKSKLLKFSYQDRAFHDQMIFKTVAEECMSITSLGVLKIKNYGAANEWNFLQKCQHLEDVTIQISIFNQRKFADIFHVFSGMRKLKVLHINFCHDESKIDNKDISDEIASFLKANNGNSKAVTLQYMELFMDIDIDDDIVQQLCAMIASVFRIKTLQLAINQHPSITNSKYVGAIVHNLHGLEHLSIEGDCFSESSIPLTWFTLMEAKISLNNQLNISKKLIIYVEKECEDKLKTALVNCYDPQIIAIASVSNFAFNNPKLWHW